MKKPTLTDAVLHLLDLKDDNQDIPEKIFQLIDEAPESSERSGLLALAYHDGIGVAIDLEKAFEYAGKAIKEGQDPLGYYILGYMCDKAETPDQKGGGPRQKYDHYDAERFYELCARQESPWKRYACNWLGEYFLDSARGGDPELGVEYLEKIAEEDAEAASTLSDYYWDIAMPDNTDDSDFTAPLFRWTKTAARLDPEEYVYRLGWLYADGIGCEKSFWLALKYFGEAYLEGDWRGADSIANLLDEKLNEKDTDANLNEEELTEFRADIAKWRERATELKEAEDSSEPDPSLEED